MMKILSFLMFFVLLTSPVFAQEPDEELLCLAQTTKYEKKEKIQTNLLTAISLVESGRYSERHKTGVSWPWTVGALKKGNFYKTKEEAIAAVEALQKQGVTNIDVGCMQINLKYHPEAFKNLQEAFDPAKNVEYAAQYLKRLYAETQSWGAAAVRYHSKSAGFAFRYEDKLLEIWQRLTQYGNPAAPYIKSEKTRAALKKNRDFFKLPRRPLIDKDKKKRILPGSEESKKIAQDWRNEKLEEYRAKKKSP